MNKARSAFIAVLVCSACAAYAIPASATTTEPTIQALPDLTGSQVNCPWGYAAEPGIDLVAHGETVIAPSATQTQLDRFSLYVTRLMEGGQPVGVPQTIAYKAYVAPWDGSTLTTGAPIWQSDVRTVTTSEDPAQEVTFETGGVSLQPGQQYALFISTEETNEPDPLNPLTPFNTSEERGCGVGSTTHDYDVEGGHSIVRYLGEGWRIGVLGTADVGFKAWFSAPVAYDFDGFYAPVNNKDASGNYVLNKVNAGAAIPVKFSLGGDYGLDIFDVGYPKSQVIACDAQAEVDGIEETVNAGSSSLTYDAGSDTYHYVWKTDRSWEDSCRQLVVKFDDGTVARANFKFH